MNTIAGTAGHQPTISFNEMRDCLGTLGTISETELNDMRSNLELMADMVIENYISNGT
ncbi:MAG: hypothetical protein GY858_05595 [Candidatus Omnitrophica bacterium]|nr:hypothetical protein [Candidatus Omnitrophota bacterium]